MPKLTIGQIRDRIRGLIVPPLKTQPSGVYMGGDVVLTKSIFGHHYYVDARDRIVAPHLVTVGWWEPWTTRVFLSLVQPGDTVVDAGANFGYYTVLAGWRVWPDGKVYAFEPLRRVAQLCYDNVNLAGHLGITRVEARGLSDRSEPREIDIFSRHVAASTLRRADLAPEQFRESLEYWKTLTDPSVEVSREVIEVAPLDDVLPAGSRLDAMKIDVEGHELALLRGARRLLMANDQVRIIVEFVPQFFSAEHNREFLGLVRELGFAVYRIEHDAALAEVSDAQVLDRPFNELLLVRP